MPEGEEGKREASTEGGAEPSTEAFSAEPVEAQARAPAVPNGMPLASEEMREVMASVSQYTELANSLRQKGQISRAIRMMERAVVMCARSEHGHPALAVEAARARVNLGAALSEGHRHREALTSIKEAQQGLGQVLIWASECNAGDAGVKSIESEARALRCAALVAEAIQLELAPSSEDLMANMLDEQLVDEAKRTAAGLGPAHPLANLVSGAIGKMPSRQRVGQTGNLPPIGQQSAPQLRQTSKKPEAANQELTAGEQAASPAGPKKKKDEPRQQNAKPVLRPRPGQADEKTDVFTDFLRTVEADRVNRLGALNDNWEDQAKRRLGQVHRTTKLQLELSQDDDLKEKRYTHTGHQVFMKNMKKANKCWSDTALVHEAGKEKAAPEICQVRKLNKQLFVKPPTPPPPPKETKPKIDSSLAGNIRGGASRSSVMATKPSDF
mmetsp:Transcript_90187/g.160633  ORF Transcript_90187/g.160633 Transcript_90187/m.160633 type:complete len:440 (+) Transcript_90187:95-1414(+)|eukprot:CAMPEP_0197655990 /NCGR_PEP_ID=MMETSP1338-20131121/39799_1 /TAXON_ID=43686 ORGANISM="Pelagodinium beii, Strain RCC1491" /NCGR_SAMPLE_ID=MMETSP1338 /ASSEMBLY_ACC=CAM_ASM_000754 /LENGTH=439 /DNA_ID=CAMNT_0043231765 /DNA_START=70 /DNA_END=1389 /DNA_ORIENTATION=+